MPRSSQERLHSSVEILASLSSASAADRARAENLRALFSKLAPDGRAHESPQLHILHSLGDRWSALILTILSCGSMRNSELQRVTRGICAANRVTPISQRILTQKLRNLERDGLLTREVWASVPPRTEYALTPLGRELSEWIDSLMRWCDRNSAALDAARLDYDKKHLQRR